MERHPWTITHGFYANMGGFAIHVPIDIPESEKFLPAQGRHTWLISKLGIQVLLLDHKSGRGELPNISEEEVKSKGKANSMAKALVCAQALWFIAQCLTRRK